MLILSRREAEKVLFPTLGITVEVTRVQGKTVRLGIEAPPEIRVIRDEIKDKPHGYYQPQPREPDVDAAAPLEIQKCLDAANLAIHLAQNQLRQDLSSNAEEALENALQCLEKLELAIVEAQSWGATSATVRESNSRYLVRAIPTTPTAVVLAGDDDLRKRLVNLLDRNGFRVVEFAHELKLLKYLQRFKQPAVVVTDNLMPDDFAPIQTLQIEGIEGLRRDRKSFSLMRPKAGDLASSTSSQRQGKGYDAETRFTAWFADSDTATDFEAILQPV